ncbi:MAG TPA: hypothetical protein VJH92_03615 [Candidatus Nanoarchaeia archaeon]|nr:hypothetical protein [Candidatus Nanoarchaeia archaeon]
MTDETYRRFENVNMVLRNVEDSAGNNMYTIVETDPMLGMRVNAVDADRGGVSELNFPPRGEYTL